MSPDSFPIEPLQPGSILDDGVVQWLRDACPALLQVLAQLQAGTGPGVAAAAVASAHVAAVAEGAQMQAEATIEASQVLADAIRETGAAQAEAIRSAGRAIAAALATR